MLIKPIKIRPFLPPKDDLFLVLKKALAKRHQKEKSVIVVTSKIVSISQGRCVKISDVSDKDELIKKEAEFYLPREKVSKGWPPQLKSGRASPLRGGVMLTMKHNIMIPTAGIDESNANGYYVLWPEKPFECAKGIYNFIKKEFGLKKFGVIISDSHTVPLRWGTMGFALAYWGFWPLKDYRGKPDIFGRKLKITQSNIADALATAAVMIMGEGNEQTPIAIIEDIDFIKFDHPTGDHPQGDNFNFLTKNPLVIDGKIDIYGPLLNAMRWRKGN